MAEEEAHCRREGKHKSTATGVWESQTEQSMRETGRGQRKGRRDRQKKSTRATGTKRTARTARSQSRWKRRWWEGSKPSSGPGEV